MTTLKTTILWLSAAFVFTPIGIAVGWAWRDMRAEPAPTVRAIQMSLTVDGYDCGDIDNNPGPLFQAAYNRREGDRYALRSYAKMPKER